MFEDFEAINPLAANDPLTQSFCAFRRAFGLESAVSMTPYQPSCVGVLPRIGPGYTPEQPYVEPGTPIAEMFDPESPFRGVNDGVPAPVSNIVTSGNSLLTLLLVLLVILLISELVP